MHLQASVEGFDVFVRSLSIGAETMVMHFEPDAPMHLRYEVAHDFLTPETGWEVVTISRLVNAFFRWEFNSCESLVLGDGRPSDRLRERLARRRADEPALLLPVGDGGARQVVRLLRRSPGGGSRSTRTSARYFDIGDREDLTLRGEAARVPPARRRLLPGRRVRGVLRDAGSRGLREVVVDYFGGPEFDALLVETVQSVFPAHEHEEMVARHRGLVGAWVEEQAA